MQNALTIDQIDQFIHQGYVKLDNAFPEALATSAREILWKDLHADPNDPSTWTEPVVRLGMYTQEPFIKSANTDILHRAFDQLVGSDVWIACRNMGTFPVRFPSPKEPGDTGWHVDASFPGSDLSDFFSWRININSKGRGLLMLFFFSDIGILDAPTRIRVGSHVDVARLLKDKGDAGLSFMELATSIPHTPHRNEVLATGRAGTVYLCHPFLVHAAQPHHGSQPRFLAQPPLQLKEEFRLNRPDGNYSPVEKAIRLGLF